VLPEQPAPILQVPQEFALDLSIIEPAKSGEPIKRGQLRLDPGSPLLSFPDRIAE
jgi:hypothetical protein